MGNSEGVPARFRYKHTSAAWNQKTTHRSCNATRKHQLFLGARQLHEFIGCKVREMNTTEATTELCVLDAVRVAERGECNFPVVYTYVRRRILNAAGLFSLHPNHEKVITQPPGPPRCRKCLLRHSGAREAEAMLVPRFEA